MAKLTELLASELVLNCELFPHHEQVAHACGIAYSELEEMLQRGSAHNAPKREATFAKRYIKADTEYAKRSWKLIQDMCEPGGKGGGANIRPLVDWYNKRWPAPRTTSIGSIVESEQTMAFSLRGMLAKPEGEVKAALDETGWVRVEDLIAAGWKRPEE